MHVNKSADKHKNTLFTRKSKNRRSKNRNNAYLKKNLVTALCKASLTS